jgi:hypothetical protein
MVALLVLSMVLVGVILMMIKQIRGYRDDASSYMSLHSALDGDDEESDI